MFDRSGRHAMGRHSKGSRARPKAGDRLRVEPLEGRALLAALAPIPSVTVNAGTGYQVPLNGNYAGNADSETFTVATDNTTGGVSATVAKGQFWTIGVSHTSDGSASDPSFSGTITLQLFEDLTPTAASKIESLITGTAPYNNLTSGLSTQQNSNAQKVIYPNGPNSTGVDYYTATNGGDTIHRISNLSGGTVPGSYIIQGGSIDGKGSGQVFANLYPLEILPQLSFNGSGQLALAHASSATTASANDSQFFITTGPNIALNSSNQNNVGYTIFGQLVAGQAILTDLAGVAVGGSGGTTPISPVTITSSTLSTTNPNGVVHIDATGATAGTQTNVTVLATDTMNGATTSQTFPVFVTPAGTTTTTTTTPPMLNTVATPIQTSVGVPKTFQLSATNPTGGMLSYIVQGGVSGGQFTSVPAQDGTASVSSSGVVTVTPNAGFSGPINLVVGVQDGTDRAGTGTSTTAPANYSLQNVTVNVGSFSTAPTLNAVATPINASVSQTVQVQLSATNPSGGQLSYTVQGPISGGAFTNIANATAAVDGNGLLSVIPNAGYTGPINLLVGVRDQTDRSGTGNLNAPGNFSTQSIVINVGARPSTGAVRFLQDTSTSATGTLIVTPLPQTAKNASNTIDVTRTPAGNAQVIVNGVTDLNQPALNDVVSIIVFGSTGNDRITVDPALTVPVLLSGGTGGKDVLAAGGGPTREQGWNATSTVEKQGESNNYLFGRTGRVTFVKGSGTNDVTFAGTPIPARGNSRIRHLPPIPRGTFYKFTDGKLVRTTNPFPKTMTTVNGVATGTKSSGTGSSSGSTTGTAGGGSSGNGGSGSSSAASVTPAKSKKK